MKRFALAAVVISLAGPAQDATSVALARINREYLDLKIAPNVTALVLLDQQLRNLMPRFRWEGRPPVSTGHLEPPYRDLGVAPALFDRDFLTYSGKLLAEAHALNSQSPLRSYTLYSTIFSPAGEASNEVPARDRAEAYVREFSAGPFIVEAHLTLAYFYDDLYKIIRLEETGRRVDYKYECYKPYLSDRPLAEQRRTAQESGVKFYGRLVELLPQSEAMKRQLSGLARGTTSGWFYCAD